MPARDPKQGAPEVMPRMRRDGKPDTRRGVNSQMPRRIFISYQHADQLTAKGFNLMRYNEHLDLEFVGRHLLDPVKSNDPDYIGRKIREQITGSSVTVVLIGDETADSEW